MKLLLYCTKSKPRLMINRRNEYKTDLDKDVIVTNNPITFNGYIVAECDFEVEEIECRISIGINGIHDEYTTKSLGENELLFASKIDEITFINYLKGKNGYAIHIKNLHIFDKPKELSDFYSINENAKELDIEEDIKEIKKAPQNMMYAFEFSKNIFERKVLISIRPEWLCKILNGEKTIEIRKRVLKEML